MDAAKQYGLFGVAAVVALAGFAAPEGGQLAAWLVAAVLTTGGVVVQSARWGMVASAGLAFGCATYLFSRKLDSASGPSLCNVSDVINCDVVNSSAASELFGIPVALLGMGFYSGLVLAALTKEGTVARFYRAATLFASVSIVYSAYLGWQSKILGAVCLMCLTMYACHAVMLAAGFKGLREREASLGDDLAGAVTSGTLLTIGAAFAVVVLVGQSVWTSSSARSGSGRLSGNGGAGQTGTKSPPPASRLSEVAALAAGPIELDGTEQVLGDPNAPYTVVEWADYGCPHCAIAAKELKVLVQELPEVQVKFKTFPLSGVCNPALEGDQGAERCKAAMAAECAGLQGKFWETSALIFANQTHLDDGDLEFMAEQAGCDMAAWETCMLEQTVLPGIVQDAIAGAKAGIHGTPTVFLAGVIPGTYVQSCRGPEGVLELVEAHKAGQPMPTPMAHCPDH